eukprot:3894962-Pleurochrysis_carterae.AAC.1
MWKPESRSAWTRIAPRALQHSARWRTWYRPVSRAVNPTRLDGSDSKGVQLGSRLVRGCGAAAPSASPVDSSCTRRCRRRVAAFAARRLLTQELAYAHALPSPYVYTHTTTHGICHFSSSPVQMACSPLRACFAPQSRDVRSATPQTGQLSKAPFDSLRLCRGCGRAGEPQAPLPLLRPDLRV